MHHPPYTAEPPVVAARTGLLDVDAHVQYAYTHLFALPEMIQGEHALFRRAGAHASRSTEGAHTPKMCADETFRAFDQQPPSDDLSRCTGDPTNALYKAQRPHPRKITQGIRISR